MLYSTFDVMLGHRIPAAHYLNNDEKSLAFAVSGFIPYKINHIRRVQIIKSCHYQEKTDTFEIFKIIALL